jgi:hypothetical protein
MVVLLGCGGCRCFLLMKADKKSLTNINLERRLFSHGCLVIRKMHLPKILERGREAR